MGREQKAFGSVSDAVDGLTSERLVAVDPEDRFGVTGLVASLAPALEYFRNLATCPSTHLPEDARNRVQNEARRLLEAFNTFLAFNPTVYVGDPTKGINELKALATGIEHAHRDGFKDTAGAVAVARMMERGFPAVEAEARGRIDRIAQAAQAHADSLGTFVAERESVLREANSRADELLQRVADLANNTAVERNSHAFLSQAATHRLAAGRWRNATFALGLVFLFVAGLDFIRLEARHMAGDSWVATHLGPANAAPDEPGVLVRTVTVRLILYGILSFAVAWCSHNFSAHRHNQVVNEHRVNALSTFQVFGAAADSDPDLKRAVLVRAAETIFAPAVTGYISKEPAPPLSPPLVQILERVSPGMGK